MTQRIAGITRGHNAGVCLLKDGEVVFALEEERLSRRKYDGAPLLSINKILEYTDKLDYLVIAHTQEMKEMGFRMDYCGEDPYTALARKHGLIDDVSYDQDNETHPQVLDYGSIHHKLHASCAFYRSGFDSAAALVVDGAGTFIKHHAYGRPVTLYETETIFDCNYPDDITTKYKHLGGNEIRTTLIDTHFKTAVIDKDDEGTSIMIADATPGIVKLYEAATDYNGYHAIEAGKTMGLSPYGEPNDEIPEMFGEPNGLIPDYCPVNLNFVTPTYPNGAYLNEHTSHFTVTPPDINKNDWVRLKNRKDVSYKVQEETQAQVLNLIRLASKITGQNNIVISGGYGLNCVANYYYLKELEDEGISIYVEPISNDAGTAMGAALLCHHRITKDTTVRDYADSLYLGPKYTYSLNEIIETADKYGAEVGEATDDGIIDLITEKNIVAMFQGQSESGPRALGNRSILYDPRDPDGKDHVNAIKRREFFRPFAGSILKEDVHEWFDLRGMEETPHMMYAVNCQPGIAEKIPSIIHVDGTCRIQTVTEDQNKNYHSLISKFKEKTGCPILFNTSFNLGGEPLVETLDDAVRTLFHSDIQYLYLPEYGKMISLKND